MTQLWAGSQSLGSTGFQSSSTAAWGAKLTSTSSMTGSSDVVQKSVQWPAVRIVSGAISVPLQNVTPGAYFDGALGLLRTSDLVVTLFKAWLFGLIAAMVACYKGMTCAQSPVGVGRAVNQATVVALMLVFAFNYIITTIYVIAYPPKV